MSSPTAPPSSSTTMLKFILNDSKVKIPKFKLNNGQEMPALALGTWLGFNDKWEFNYHNVDLLTEVLTYGIDIGYRHIDTAHYYRVEPEVGEVVQKVIRNGIAKREELFITTKVWQHYHREADVETSVRASLRRTKLEYFDMVVMHWPMSISQEGVDEKIDYLETWRGFESVLEKGLTKGIGVSNFNLQQLQRLKDNCNVVPACLQIEVNLNLAQTELVDYCKANGIVVVGFSPFGTMIQTRSFPGSPEPRSTNQVMMGLAQKHQKTITQIVLRYLHQRGIVPVPKMLTKSRALENATIFDFALDSEDMQALAAFDTGFRTTKPVFWQDFENYPFNKVTGTSTVEIPEQLRSWMNGKNQDVD